MATKRMIAREKKLARHQDQATRNALKHTIVSQDSTPQERMQAMLKLQKRPVDESPVRRMNRCHCCGRPRAVLRRFKLCRLCLRKFAVLRYIPGLTKSSW